MIRAMIFDLDGTLVDTELLKAQAYAVVLSRLKGAEIPKSVIVDLYKNVVGQARDAISRYLMESLGLGDQCRALMPQYSALWPWQVLTVLRVAAYQELIADPQVLQANQWGHNVELLRLARSSGCRTALVTSSYTAEAEQVLAALGLRNQFDAVVGLDQVQHPKPDPEVYLTASARLGVPPEECMVIEDSPPGIQAALAAGMYAIAVATPFTCAGLHTGSLEHQWVVHEPEELLAVVERRIQEHNRIVHRSSASGEH